MIFDYIITLRKKNYRGIDFVSHLLLFMSVVSFGMFSFETKIHHYYLVVCLLISGVWVYLIARKRKKGTVYFRLPLLLSAIGWLIQPHRQIVFTVLYAIAGLIEKQVKFPEEIGFSEDSIVFNSFPKKRYNWNEIKNVVLKDNILTVDFKNNKLVQKETEEEVSMEVEAEFNEFCRKQLMKRVSSQ